MKFIKNYRFILNFLTFVIISTLIISIISLIFPLSLKVNKLLSLISILLYLFLTNLKEGKNLEKDAYKNGIKRSAIIIILIYIIGSLITDFSLSVERLIYYLILIICIVLGNIIGINKKKS